MSSWLSVLLPEPLFPITKVVSPAGKKNVDGWRTIVPGWLGYAKDTYGR